MKVEFRAIGTGPANWLVLADESAAPLNARISGWQPRFSSSPQEEPGFNAPGVAVFDNGNGKWTVGFLVERFHTTADAALTFLATHSPAVAGLGNVDLKITVGGAITFLVAAACTEITPEPHSDQNTRIRYTFTSGLYTNTNQP